MDSQVIYTYGINSTAFGYTLRGVIRGLDGDVKFIERNITANGMRQFYKRSGHFSTQQRIIKVNWRCYDKIFGKVW